MIWSISSSVTSRGSAESRLTSGNRATDAVTEYNTFEVERKIDIESTKNIPRTSNNSQLSDLLTTKKLLQSEYPKENQTVLRKNFKILNYTARIFNNPEESWRIAYL